VGRVRFQEEEFRVSDAVMEVMRAIEFAAGRHALQKRKGALKEPYLNHLVSVANLLAKATAGSDFGLITAGLLHDVIEDTDTSTEDLERHFNPEIVELVLEVTDDKSLPKLERKRLQIEKAPNLSKKAKQLKLADLAHNLESIATSPPGDWSRERRREYIGWANLVAAGCRGVDEFLESKLDDASELAEDSLRQ
jgi:(p)ppGpp synthase/HD superfamily hydrolase